MLYAQPLVELSCEFNVHTYIQCDLAVFVWLEAPSSGRVEWRYTCQRLGVPFSILTQVQMKPRWFADNWGMLVVSAVLSINLRLSPMYVHDL